ncbi:MULTISPECIES: ABC transporter substrate-binding protein [unclassified Microbacterium]|uniref:ABC transporter substrate-binding protein n=1 Tax=unclassified Microbacterium TaxID=2609290 RepID=UPI001DBFAAF6|nr:MULTISPECIES: ABC transporter substrate-binding protein [unclassified Microbacterium]CAH0204009.1 Riboflavin-binding protein RibY [Microbacterium sp. Bi121]HWK78852.1 ABC transporter substrate-binding protein [Microbacterium sp.]
MKKSGNILSVAALLTASALALTGCGGASETPASEGDAGGEMTDVTLMLNWYPYGEHAAFYYGVEQGIFEDHGINLTIKAGQGSTKTAQAVGQGQVDFGWADTPAVLANIDKGVAIKSVGVFLQTTPSAVQVFADSGIESPEDLKGKTIAVSAGDAPTTTFPVYLDAVGLKESDVKQQNLDAAGKIAAVLSGQVDGLIGFAHDQGPTIAAKSGKEMRYLRYSDAGLNFFSNGLVAPTSTIESDPELVKELVAATSEAFTAAQEDPEAAVAAMDGKDPQMPAKDVLLDQWQETIKLLSTAATEGKAPGTNATEDWEATLSVLSDAGLISGDGDVDTYFDASFAPGE